MSSRLALAASIALLLVGAAPAARADPADECVVLLHGLARGAGSMEKLAASLREAGYAVANVDYPSRSRTIEELAPLAVGQGLAACRGGMAARIHFVTHSMGGILLRQYVAAHEIPELGRVVMLGPPNQGSEVVDRLAAVPGFRLINGPAGAQLGTGADGVPGRLGPVTFQLGVIAGTRTMNPILSLFLPNPDDGKVSVARTRIDGMADFLALPHTHPFLMRSDEVIRQTLHFLQHGRFDCAEAAH